ncbi:MAG: T9SS type A sorting domain-containing protein [Lewinellaceae bacterium]|nr:T9SS type A sorting domain-containing protein [Lewinellaceae bacterium]
MGSRKKLILGFWGGLFSAFILLNYSANPPNGYTGAPGDSLCTSCHSTPPPSVNGTISLTGLPSTVTPNTTYTITLTSTVTGGSPLTAGFQMVALNASNQNAGDFAANSPDEGTETSGGREYVEHRGDKTISGGMVSWDFDWTSPATGSGTITMYAASNLSNNNGQNTGDKIITNTFTTTLQSGGPALMVVISSSTNVSCFGGNNGSATAMASGGTPPYTYQWSNGQSGATASNLSAGFYTVTVTDGVNGTATASITITQPPILNAAIISQNNVLCFGGNNGTALANATGGTAPYTYSWSNGQSGPVATNLGPGSYTVTVTDAHQCTKTAVAIITQPPLLVAQIASQTNVDCFGSNTGSVAINPVGGTGPYNFFWSNNGSGPVQTNLFAGTYTVTVTDSHGCSATKAVVITQPPLLVATIVSSTQVDCFGASTGSATAGASGGSSPYSYAWSSGANTATATNLPAGSYTVTVSDNKGCTAVNGVSITQPPAITVQAVVTPAGCNGNCDGAIATTSGGGTPPLSYSWEGGSNLPDTSNLCAGSYSLTVADGNGCLIVQSFSVSEPTPLSIEVVSIQEVDCHGNSTGAVAVTANGGPAPVTYLWSTGDTTATLSGLPAGEYAVTATDGNACTGSLTVSITEPPLLEAGVTVTHETAGGANDGTATANPTGGTPPYTYSWSNGETTAGITGLAPGSYTVTVTDAQNCEAIETVIINPFDCILTVGFSSVDVSCAGGNDGEATALPENGTAPFTFNWSTGATGDHLTGLSAGTYSVTILDGANCSATGSIVIAEPDPLGGTPTVLSQVLCFGGATGSVSLLAEGGTPDPTYAYVWGDTIANLPPSEAFLRSDLAAGAYEVTVVDGNACEAILEFSITQPDVLTAGVTVMPESAFGANDGSATITPGGGAGNFSYLWSTGETTASISGLAPGAYPFTVTDGNGCTTSGEALIEAFNCTLVLEMSVSDVLCFGDSSGTATAIPSSGTEPYTYAWSTGSDQPNLSGLAPGIYSVTVIDASNCPVEDSVEVGTPTPVSLALDSLENVSCPGGSDGFIGLLAEGGTPGYTYAWSVSGPSGPFGEDLSAGAYAITVFDANQCETTIEVTVEEPDPLDLQANSTNETANGAGDGTASVDPIGGTPPYGILWSTGETTDTITGLSPGNYSATVTDAHGCVAEASVVVNPFDCALTVSSLASNVGCAGGADGSVLLAITGATEPVEIQVNGELWQDGTEITGLSAGSYIILVSDASFCSFTETIDIQEPDLLNVEIASVQDKICAGDSTGTVSLLTSGGTGNYSFQWDDPLPGNDSAQRENLPAGVYSVTVTDQNGCTASLAVTIQETVLEWTAIDVTPVACAEDGAGSAGIQVSGGAIPYVFEWSNGGGGPQQSGLNAGLYSIIITDGNGCSTTAEVEIVSQDTIAPLLLCPEDIIGGNCDGVVNYALTWTDNCEVQDPVLIEGLESGATFPEGTTTVTWSVSDFSGNEAICSFTVTLADLLSGVAVSTPSCPNENTGSATVTPINGTAPYNFLWNDDQAQTGQTATGLAAGPYSVLITDAAGCAFTAEVQVDAFPEVEILVSAVVNETNGQGNGSIDITVSGGALPYSFEWSKEGEVFSEVEDPQDLTAGTYTVLVTDANSCTYSSGEILVDNISAVGEVDGLVQYRLYPNPGSDFIWLEWTGPAPEGVDVELLDLTGRVQYQSWWTGTKKGLDVSRLTPGLYWLRLGNGEWQSIQKVLIQR